MKKSSSLPTFHLDLITKINPYCNVQGDSGCSCFSFSLGCVPWIRLKIIKNTIQCEFTFVKRQKESSDDFHVHAWLGLRAWGNETKHFLYLHRSIVFCALECVGFWALWEAKFMQEHEFAECDQTNIGICRNDVQGLLNGVPQCFQFDLFKA